MNNISTQFSIKDLENLSGIKAHTIRIWEKRYGVLEPSRTDSNIRYYDISSLQKLLNVTLLYNAGHKISKIAAYEENELESKIREQITRNSETTHHIDALKLAMFNFDQSLFEFTYSKLMNEQSFRSIFIDVFVPLLQDIGLEWQSNTITPAHEHFISNLVSQKLQINIERIKQNPPKDNKQVYVLFLPLNEIHEFGLLYMHYELLLKGYHSIYLGQSVPMENLKVLQKVFDNIYFVSNFTVKPDVDDIDTYLSDMSTEILRDGKDKLFVLGRKIDSFPLETPYKNTILFNNITNMLDVL